MSNVLKSRKFWAAVVAVVVIVVNGVTDGKMQLNEAELLSLVITIVGFMGSTAYEDGQKAKALAEIIQEDSASDDPDSETA